MANQPKRVRYLAAGASKSGPLHIPIPVSRILPITVALYVAATSLQAQTLQMNTVYQCQVPLSFKVLSCTGDQPNDTCDVQSFNAGRPFQRGKSTYAQVMTLVPRCHVQTPAEAQAAARGEVAPGGTGPGGFKVGDRVRILSNGWQEGTVVQIRGNMYVVRLPGGIDVPKPWPVEVRRIGKLTAEDHAVGQYDTHDRVQALFNGRWTEGEIVGQQGNMYTVKLPGIVTSTDFGVQDTITTTPENIRISNTPPPPPPAKRPTGQIPKAGLASCSGKFEGRYEMSNGMGGMRVVFRSGNVTVNEALGGDIEYECFTGGGKIVLYKAGSFTPYDTYDLNSDGTIQTPLGEIKKRGN